MFEYNLSKRKSRSKMKKNDLNTEITESYYPVTLMPEVLGLGWSTFRQGTLGGPRPSSSKSWEICFVDEGSVEWWIHDELFETGPKSLFINKPGEWHGGASGMVQPCEMYWIQFFFPPEGELPGLHEQTVAEIKKIFSGMQKRHFPASAQMQSFFEQLLDEQRRQTMYAESAARAAFHQILIGTARDYLAQEKIEFSPSIKKALDWMDAHATEDFHSEHLARQVGLSVGHFYKLFRQEVGLSPANYYVRQRLSRAKQLLRNSTLTITDIAVALGFSSSQYFSTVFKRYVGLSPSEYRRLRQEKRSHLPSERGWQFLW